MLYVRGFSLEYQKNASLYMIIHAVKPRGPGYELVEFNNPTECLEEANLVPRGRDPFG